MSKMNIGFFADCWEPQINGVITSMKNLEQYLLEKKNSVYKFAPKSSDSIADPTLFLQNAVKYVFQKEFSLASPLPYRALHNAREWKLDLVHSHSEFSLGRIGLTVAKHRKIPCVTTIHTLWETYGHYLFWGIIPVKIIRDYMIYFYNTSDYLIVPSIRIKNHFQGKYGVRPHMEIIPTGINLDNYTSSKFSSTEKLNFRAKHSIKKDDIVCILVGRIGKEKSIVMAVKAFAALRTKHPKLKLLLVGGGPQQEEIKLLTKTLGIENTIIFAGYIPQNKIPLAYNASDFFITASTTETQGLTSIEAMATGLPLVLRQDDVQHEVAGSNENALFFTDEKELISRIDSLLGNPQLKAKLIENSLKRSHNFSLSAFGIKVENYYKDIIKDFHK